MAWWRHTASDIIRDFGSGNDFVPGVSELLPESILTYHQSACLAFIPWNDHFNALDITVTSPLGQWVDILRYNPHTNSITVRQSCFPDEMWAMPHMLKWHLLINLYLSQEKMGIFLISAIRKRYYGLLIRTLVEHNCGNCYSTSGRMW